jgi:hypothetical protein
MTEYSSSVQPWGLDPVQQQALAGAVEWHVRRGWRVESAPMPGQVVVVMGKRPNHILHLLLSVVTFGLWLPVWFVIGVTSKVTRAVLTVHPDGTVSNSLQRIGPPPPWYRESSTWGAIAVVVVVVWLVYAFN